MLLFISFRALAGLLSIKLTIRWLKYAFTESPRDAVLRVGSISCIFCFSIIVFGFFLVVQSAGRPKTYHDSIVSIIASFVCEKKRAVRQKANLFA
jgi:hypothetical protein